MTAATAETLASLKLSYSYRNGEDDVAREFYLPCHALASEYDRAVGFFSSSIYAIAWPSLRCFVEGGGKIRLICSPVLSEQDQIALTEGHAAADQAQAEAAAAASLRDEVRRLLANPYLSKPTRVLASLVAIGVVEVKVAFLDRNPDARSRTIFHDKVGIFRDQAGNAVVFKGSMNETWSGLSGDGNLESVDVFVSWAGDRERERVEDETRYFGQLWENTYPTVRVRDFPEVARSELLDSADPQNWVRLVDEISSEIELAGEISPDKRPGGRTPRRHQVEALQAWRDRGRRGILEHATGSGKTFTALCAMGEALERGETPIVLVPSALLTDQWEAEVRDTFSGRGVGLLVCDSRNPEWRSWLGPYTRARRDEEPRAVIASMSTAAGDDFIGRVRQGEHLFLVADEVHALGSVERRKVFGLATGPRLGLSATPRRAGDPEGTDAIFDYFGGVVPPPFTLQDAVQAGALCKYFYHVHTVRLSSSEQGEWDALTNEIKRLYAIGATRGGDDVAGAERMRHLLLLRARIAKRAAGKVPLAEQVLQDSYKPGQRWLVYCDARPQLSELVAVLHKMGLPATEYHSGMTANRSATLAHFQDLGGILVAIKCLDEGVDIPAVDHALILASSKNPREFIQRRGRVLRTHPGKHLAAIHDAVVIPDTTPGDDIGNRMLAGELARAVEFGRGSTNPSSITDIELIAHAFELDLVRSEGEGIEEDETTDE